MLTTIIRTVILYLTVIISVRLMGKRQIGELQPVELVITILLSEIVAIPIQDNNIPLVNSLVPVMLLVGFEILQSAVSMKSLRFQLMAEGNPLLVIRNGKIDQTALKKLRFSINDLLSALRQKDVFNPDDVQYAIMETNGQLSVMIKPNKEPLTAADAGIKATDDGLYCPVILDGHILKNRFSECGLTLQKLNDILKKENVKPAEILLLNINSDGKMTLVKKEK